MPTCITAPDTFPRDGCGWLERVDQVKPSEEEIVFIFVIDINGDGKMTLMEATKSAQLLKDRFGVTEVKCKVYI